VNPQSAMSRQFEASAGFFGLGPNFTAKRSYKQVYGLAAAVALPVLFIGALGAINPHAAQSAGRIVSYAMVFLLVLGLAGWFAYYHLHNSQKIVVSVTADAVTINKRPGDVYAFSDARFGRWAYGDRVMGTALHLHSSARQFVLGGRDHRVGEGTRLDESPVMGVDAWLPADQFDELLAMVGPRSGLDVHPTAPGGPVRCLLFPNTMRAQQMAPFAMKKRREFLQSVSHAKLAIDIAAADEIRVLDYGSKHPDHLGPARTDHRETGDVSIPRMGNGRVVTRGCPRTSRNRIPVGDAGNDRVPSRDGGTDDCLS
jgi:hypothetical protein